MFTPWLVLKEVSLELNFKAQEGRAVPKGRGSGLLRTSVGTVRAVGREGPALEGSLVPILGDRRSPQIWVVPPGSKTSPTTHTGLASCQDVEATQADGSQAGPPGARAEQRRTETLQSIQIETARPPGPDAKLRPYCSSAPPSGLGLQTTPLPPPTLYPQETAKSLIRFSFCPWRLGSWPRWLMAVWDSTHGRTDWTELGC